MLKIIKLNSFYEFKGHKTTFVQNITNFIKDLINKPFMYVHSLINRCEWLSKISQNKIDTTDKKKKHKKWTFWSIYIDHGLNGSLYNLFILNPVALILTLCELSVNVLSTWATTEVTKTITSVINISNTTTNVTDVVNKSIHEPNLHVNIPDASIQTWVIALMLLPVVFSVDISSIVKRLLRPSLLFYKNKLLAKIHDAVIKHMYLTSFENDKEFGTNDRFEALNRFIWVYDNITDTIINTAVQTARSMTFCAYLIWKVPALFPLLLIVYAFVLRVIIPRSNKKKRSSNSEKLWERAYYDVSIVGINKINPNFKSLYDRPRKHDEQISIVNNLGEIDEKSVQNKEFYACDDKTLEPNIGHKYMDIVGYYAKKHQNFTDTSENLKIIYDAIVLIIIIILVHIESYETALIVLINRGSLFGMINTYSDMLHCEKNADQSLEKIVKILEAVDKQYDGSCNSHNADHTFNGLKPIDSTLLDGKIIVKCDNENSLKSELKKRIEAIEILDLQINIPAQSTKQKDKCEKENKIDHGNSEYDDFAHVSHDRLIRLEHTKLAIIPGTCLMLDGKTGCGKSVTINALAGLTSEKLCKSLKISFDDGKTIETQFNEMLHSRCYISQNLSNDLNYNDKLSLPLFKLFPGAKTINEVTNFLTKVFEIKLDSIPTSLEDHPHSKLSGGELQRYVVASQVWKALKLKTDIMILDEIDRALDKETAVNVLTWLTQNVPSFFILVTHLTEVKNELFKRGVIKQVWRYENVDERNIKIVCSHI
jgi:ABC-type dipeptide/oligopeptide/nickel transport system ATPase subunit